MDSAIVNFVKGGFIDFRKQQTAKRMLLVMSCPVGQLTPVRMLSAYGAGQHRSNTHGNDRKKRHINTFVITLKSLISGFAHAFTPCAAFAHTLEGAMESPVNSYT